MSIQITFLQDYRVFKKRETYMFQDGQVNLLVGDQGCGKSSLLDLLAKPDPRIIQVDTGPSQLRTRFFDFERDNPRIRDYGNDPIKFKVSIVAKFSSHGEFVNSIVRSISKLDTDVVLMDEPDMALSIRSMNRLAQALKACPTTIIASAHNPILIGAVERVLSLEHKRWMTAQKFIESHRI